VRAHTNTESTKLRLSAYRWGKNDYEIITENLHWSIKATEIFFEQSHLKHADDSLQAQPEFHLSAGVYSLEVSCDLGEKTIEDIVLHPGSIVDEVVYFGKIGIDDREENYDLNGDESFSRSSEYLRRLDERDGQRQFASHADPLRNPDLTPPAQPGHEYDQGLEANSEFKAHPILSKAKQFDGIGMDSNRDTSRNQHAAEAKLQPSLAPGAKPTMTISAPTPSPFHGG
jgi:hypothetical protein